MTDEYQIRVVPEVAAQEDRLKVGWQMNTDSMCGRFRVCGS